MRPLERRPNLHWPNLLKRSKVEDDHGITIRVGPVNPESRGKIALRSANPGDPPRIFANYLRSEADKETTIARRR